MKRKFHVISNTHWDREWRFPFQRNRQMLVDMIDKVLEILSTNPEYRAFHLDSQSIVIKDYLEIKPQKKELITKLVSEKRLLIGPWYILPEEFQVGGENLIRNLLIGHKICNEHGGVSKIGYSPFSWGQISQLPQLYKEFRINLIMFYRGVNSLDSKKSEFLWVGADGTRAITSRFSTMPRYNFYFYIYRPAVFDQGFYDVEHEWNKFGVPFHFADNQQNEEDYFLLNPEKKYFEKNIPGQVEAIIKDQADDFTTPNVIWMEGHDSSGPNDVTVDIIKDIKKVFPDLDVVHSTLEDYADAVYQSVDVEKLKVVEGERRSAQYDRRSGNMYGYTTSARMYLKQKNFDAERWIQYYAEPFNVFAGMFGKDIADNYTDIAWDYIVQNSAHDSIGGCSLDEIHEDMMFRYKQSIEISRGVFERALKHFAAKIDNSKIKISGDNPDIFITLVNTNIYKRNEIIELNIDVPQKLDKGSVDIYDINGERVKTEILNSFDIEPVLEQMINRPMYYAMKRYIVRVVVESLPGFAYKTLSVIPVSESNSILRKDGLLYFKGRVENGYIRVSVNQNGSLDIVHKKTGKKFEQIGQLCDEGEAGHAWVHESVEPVVTTENSTPEIIFEEKSPLVCKIVVNHNLRIPADLKSRKSGIDNLVVLTAKVTYTISSESKFVEISAAVNNPAESHRLRMIFPTGIDAEYSWGEGQFDVVKRTLDRPDTSDWVEQPMYDFPMHNFVDLSDGNIGAAILVDGLKEYEILPDGKNSIAITLFRAFEYIIAPSSKQDYTWQKGAQCLGESNYRLAFYPHEGDWESGDVFKEAFNFNNEIRAFQTGKNNGELYPEMTLLEIENSRIVFSALKKAEDGMGYILRLYNPTGAEINTSITFPCKIGNVTAVSLEELSIEDIRVFGEKKFAATFAPKSIRSFKIVL